MPELNPPNHRLFCLGKTVFIGFGANIVEHIRINQLTSFPMFKPYSLSLDKHHLTERK
jgi:hypothetical protein